MRNLNVREVFQPVLMFALLCAGAVIAPMEAKAAPAAKSIEVTGQTADKKYPIYKIEGDYEDVKYFANGKAYTSGDLFGKMKYIKKEDVNANGYKCGFICKDSAGHTVGINPNFAFLAPKK